jgi:hypothetical protein
VTETRGQRTEDGGQRSGGKSTRDERTRDDGRGRMHPSEAVIARPSIAVVRRPGFQTFQPLSVHLDMEF